MKKNVFLVTLLVGVLVGSEYLGAWTGPTGNAPLYNVEAPINVGATTQTKAGILGVTDLLANTVSTNGNIETDTAVHSPAYCNADGSDCTNYTDIDSVVNGGGGGGSVLETCTLGYRFRRNTGALPWQSVALDGTSNTGSWSTWSVTNLSNECDGSGCGVQMRITCP